MRQTAIACARAAGAILRARFGRVRRTTRKGDQSNVVTEADMASERRIVDIVERRFPDHNILAEETGLRRKSSDITWVIDPLDGTSNYAAGIPWYGVLIAVLRGTSPVFGVMYLPDADLMYVAERGKGTTRNGKRVAVTRRTDLADVLCAYGLDATPDERRVRREALFLSRLVNRVRNIRGTNSAVDFCYTVDGRLGACVNHDTKIWDIAPFQIALEEAGGRLSDREGRKIRFDLTGDPCGVNYSIIGASPVLQRKLAALARTSGF